MGSLFSGGKAVVLSAEIILLISPIIVIMDMLKSSRFLQAHLAKVRHYIELGLQEVVVDDAALVLPAGDVLEVALVPGGLGALLRLHGIGIHIVPAENPQSVAPAGRTT